MGIRVSEKSELGLTPYKAMIVPKLGQGPFADLNFGDLGNGHPRRRKTERMLRPQLFSNAF